MVVRSILVTNGYFNNPSATADAFIYLPDSPPSPLPTTTTSSSTTSPPSSSEDDATNRWFATGDIAILRNQKFYIVDRLKELLKYKGQQIAPAELENVLAAHPCIAEAAVVGVRSTHDEGDDLPRAYVVRTSAGERDSASRSGGAGGDGIKGGEGVGGESRSLEITEEEVKNWIKANLAPHKQLRGGVVFVSEIPKNAVGKYLRRELRERARLEVERARPEIEGGVGKARL
jgi:4-coumarate--CoA ligase